MNLSSPMDHLIPDLDLYYLLEHVSQGNDAGTPQTYLPRQPPAGVMGETPHRSSDSLSMHSSLRGHQHHHQHQNLYQPLRAVATHPYYASTTAPIPPQMYISDVESSPPVMLSSSSPYRVGAPGSSNDIPGHLFVDSMEHGNYDNQNTMLSGCEAYMEEIPVRGEPGADRVRLPAKQYVDQAYTVQDPPRQAGPVKPGRKKRQETDDEMSELESSDSRKTNADTTRQRGRPRLDTRDESQAEVS